MKKPVDWIFDKKKDLKEDSSKHGPRPEGDKKISNLQSLADALNCETITWPKQEIVIIPRWKGLGDTIVRIQQTQGCQNNPFDNLRKLFINGYVIKYQYNENPVFDKHGDLVSSDSTILILEREETKDE